MEKGATHRGRNLFPPAAASCGEMRALETFDAEKTGDAGIRVNTLNSLAQKWRDAEHGDRQSPRFDGHRIGRDELVNEPATQALVSHFVEDAVADCGADTPSAVFAEHFSGGGQSTRRLGDVVDEENVAAFDFTDDIDRFNRGRVFAFFGHETETGAKDVGVRGGHFHTTDVGRTNDEFVALGLREVIEENR